MIKSFRHKGLEELFLTGQSGKVPPGLHAKCLERLDALDHTVEEGDINIPGFNLHFPRTEDDRPGLVFVLDDAHVWKIGLMGALNNQKQHYVANRPSRPPTHPGIIVRNNVLPALMLSVEQAVGELKVPPDLLSGILQGTHPVTPDMAIRLGKFCGNGHQFWLRMQEAHDLWLAQDRLREELASIPCRQPPLAA